MENTGRNSITSFNKILTSPSRFSQNPILLHNGFFKELL